MLKKIFIILLIPVLAELVFSCCDCNESLKGKYVVKSVIAENLDNADQFPKVTTASTIQGDAYGIRFHAVREVIACRRIKAPGFFQSAYAMSCDCPPDKELFPADSVVSIKIVTLNDFNESHPANEDVSEYFWIYQSHDFKTVDEFFNKSSVNWINAPVGMYDGALLSSEIEVKVDMLLMTPPEAGGKHQFRLEVTLASGTVLEDTTDEITLE